MLRLVIALAVWVLSVGAAMPDPAEDAARTAKSAADAIILTGPVGALFILVVIGLIVALGAAGMVIRTLWNTIKDRDAATEAMRKGYDGAVAILQEKRAAELVENTKQVAQTAISGSAAITASNDRLADIAGRVSILAERLLPIPTEIVDIKARMGDISRSCGRGGA